MVTVPRDIKMSLDGGEPMIVRVIDGQARVGDITVTFPGPGTIVESDTYRYTTTEPRYHGTGNRHDRRKAAAQRRRAGNWHSPPFKPGVIRALAMAAGCPGAHRHIGVY